MREATSARTTLLIAALCLIAASGFLWWSLHHQSNPPQTIDQTTDPAALAFKIAGTWDAPKEWNREDQKNLAINLYYASSKARGTAVGKYKTQSAKSTPQDQDPNRANAGMAILFIIDSQKTIIYDDTDFELGYQSQNPENHAEAKMMTWAKKVLNQLSSQSRLSQGIVVNMLIFSYSVFCDKVLKNCLFNLTSHKWVKDLYDATHLPPGTATVNLFGWQGNLKPDGTSIEPGNIDLVGFVYGGTTNGAITTTLP